MIDLVIGGNYGSEGKGSVSSWLGRQAKASDCPYDVAIRVGGANAGHTFKALNGETYKMRHLPCVWDTSPQAIIYLASGSIIDPDVFFKEEDMVRKAGFMGDILISPYAFVVEPESKSQERSISTGTTGEGIGATRAKACLRQAMQAGDFRSPVQAYTLQVWEGLHRLTDNRKNILIESSQGHGLSLHSKAYPYVTSIDINTYQILSDSDIPYGVHDVRTWMIVRTYPIRIAGNSGALFNELSWDILRKRHGNHIPVEQTTVTKKTRRVGEFDPDLVRSAINRCRPTFLVLTFLDYLFPDIAKHGFTQPVIHYLDHLEAVVGRRFTHAGIGTGEVVEIPLNKRVF